MRVILFYVLFGLTYPTFTEFLYYFKLEVLGLTQFQYALLALVGSISMFVGIMVYSIWLKEAETRTLILISIFFMILGSLFSVALTLKWYE